MCSSAKATCNTLLCNSATQLQLLTTACNGDANYAKFVAHSTSLFANLTTAWTTGCAPAVLDCAAVDPYAVPALSVCYDGTCAESSSDCPVATPCPICPARRNRCPPNLPVRCRDGECRADMSDCPTFRVCPPESVRCDDGSCAAAAAACPVSSYCNQGQIHCPDDAHIRLAQLQRSRTDFQRPQPRRLLARHPETRSAEPKLPRNPARNHPAEIPHNPRRIERRLNRCNQPSRPRFEPLGIQLQPQLHRPRRRDLPQPPAQVEIRRLRIQSSWWEAVATRRPGRTAPTRAV